MALSEIEKLERRYAENPQGLTFAPLAEVHRKNGDVARALELLRAGLELHPDYIPASIVLGRCHWDLGDLEASEVAFAHALELDGENVIALKALADINERLHRLDRAERLLQQLLSVDRSNEEAQAQLERIEAARQAAAEAPQPDTEASAAATEAAATEAAGAEAAATEAAGAEAAGAEATSAEATSAEAAPAEAPREAAAEPEAEPEWAPEPRAEPVAAEAAPLALDDLEPTTLGDGEAEPPPPGLVVEEPEVLEEEVEPLAGLVGREMDRPAAGEPEFKVEMSEDIVLHSSGGHEFQVPSAAEELTSGLKPSDPFGETGLEVPPDDLLAEPPRFMEPPDEPELAPMLEQPSEPETPAEPELLSVPEAVAETAAVGEPAAQPVPRNEPELLMGPASAPAPAAPPVEPAAEPEPVVTESMAEVLLQQGHPTEALLVYRELEARSPGDPRVRQRIAELEEADLRRHSEPAAPRRSYTAAETGGGSVGDLLRGILSQRLPTSGGPAPRAVSPPAEGAGAPTRPAADALSLSSVFGDEANPLPPAVPAAGAPPAGGVSYDEFFGQQGSGGGSPKSRGSDQKGDDLDQFHAWLQNLKR